MTYFFKQSLLKPLVFAHRGASEEYPENTLLAFEMAIKQGAAGIETDLQYTQDHQIVCFHDQSLSRISTLAGKIRTTTRQELSKARIKHKVYDDQPIPALIDLLEWLPKEIYLILELKDDQFQNQENMAAFFELLARYGVIEKTIVASFSMANLQQVKRVLPSMPTCFITPYNPSTRISADILAPFFPVLWLHPAYVKNAHAANKAVSVWDPHPERRINHYIDQQIEIVTGDSPQKLRDAISQVQK